MFNYMHGLQRERFAKFVAEHAVVLHAGSDSTPMRLSTSGTGNTGSLEIYVRTLVARSENGTEMKFIPELSRPENSTAAGVLSTITPADLFIPEFVSRPGFRILMITMGGIATNRAALRLLVSELQAHQQLLVITSICSSHTLSNATRWGMGTFPYGKYLRTSHVLDAVKHRGFEAHVAKFATHLPISVKHRGFTHPDCFVDHAASDGARKNPTDETTSANKTDNPLVEIWRKFTDFVKGQKGPFSKKSPRADSDNLAKKCAELWPLGPPSRGNLWHCAEGKTSADYLEVISSMFGHSIPLPVSSRWYGSAFKPKLS